MTTLSHERAGVARLHLAMSSRLRSLLAEPRAAAAVADPRLRDRVASIWSDIACMRLMTERSFAQVRQGGQPSGALGSLTKLMWGRTDQRLAELAVDLLGMEATTGRWATQLASSRQTTIAGGTTEINKNIVAEHGLGLPRS
jgi:alkylation response protein AidB-like acyl-CoA dehydrogenase